MIHAFIFFQIIGNFKCIEQNQNMQSHTGGILQTRWDAYKKALDLKLNDTEDEYRLKIYRQNMEFAHLFNAENYSFKLGETPFTHLTNEEFAMSLVAMNPSIKEIQKVLSDENSTSKANVSDKDWRKENKVTAIKNQGQCQCGYAFAATAVVESLNAIKQNKTMDVSEQELVDCSTGYGNRGCTGGSVINSLKYIKDIGIYPEMGYSYVGKQGTCKRPSLPPSTPVKISGYVGLPAGDESTLASTISTKQPVAVMIFASLKTFQLYKTGVYYDPACNSTDINHGVLAVGVGSAPSPHYILKNSWGTSWGDNGYMLLVRDKQNHCGVASNAVYPTL